MLGLLGAGVRGAGPDDAAGASHREAPAISRDPTADISDFFFFRSYEPGKARKVVLAMDVIPGEEPSSGPNYYAFDPSVRYMFHVDNDRDGKANDVSFEFRFRDQERGVPEQLGLFLAVRRAAAHHVAHRHGIGGLRNPAGLHRLDHPERQTAGAREESHRAAAQRRAEDDARSR